MKKGYIINTDFYSKVTEKKEFHCSNFKATTYENRVISIKSKNGMTQAEIYQKMLSFSKK